MLLWMGPGMMGWGAGVRFDLCQNRNVIGAYQADSKVMARRRNWVALLETLTGSPVVR
jgi:hypothetical protein